MKSALNIESIYKFKLTTYSFLLVGFFFTINTFPLSRSIEITKEEHENVLFIIADDLSTTLGCYGVEGVKTPNIDKLASRGLKFNRAYCQASLCNPSRASIMTGRRPDNLRIWSNDPHFRGIYPKIITLPEYFKANGYHTAGIGKIFHNWGQPIHGDSQSWSEPEQYNWAAHYQDWYVVNTPYQIHSDIKKGAAVQYVDVPDEAYLDGRIANAAVSKLKELQETPFFLAVGFWKPHLPYNAPKKYWDLYDRNKLPAISYTQPVTGVPDIAYVNSDEARSYADIPKTGEIPDEKTRELRHGYLAAISYLDAQIGKVLDELDRLNLTDKTTIVFTSDHGYHAGEHGQFGKWTNFELGTRVPLIISSPKITKPKTSTNSIVELVDIYPTLAEINKLPHHKEYAKLDGQPLIPVLINPDVKTKPYAISQIARPVGAGADFPVLGSTIRSDNFRYTMWVDRATNKVLSDEFYDLSKDFFEVNNQAGNTKILREKQELAAELLKVLER